MRKNIPIGYIKLGDYLDATGQSITQLSSKFLPASRGKDLLVKEVIRKGSMN